MRSWEGKSIVITGASAGLGRAAALQFASQGASLTLAARRISELEETARLCREAGGHATAVATDVTREAEVRALAETAVATWGRIDVWINNAGVTTFARLEDGPFDEHRRVLETNLIGSMLGARAVLPVFWRQKRGVLINVGSLLSRMGHAFVPSYAISKFGVRGLSEALRVEVADAPEIHVCTFMPYAVHTQHFESGGNRTGLQPRPLPPTQSPESVATALVGLAARPRRELHVPRVAALGIALHALLPRTVERLLLHALESWHFAPAPQPVGSGNLFQPTREPAAVHGRRGPRIGVLHLGLWAIRDLLGWTARAPRAGAPYPAPEPAPSDHAAPVDP